MREFAGYFDKLYFTESVLGVPIVEGTRLRLPVRGIFLLSGHPLEHEGSGPFEGELVFYGVSDSRRTVTEYIGDSRNPTGFNSPREVIDEVATGTLDAISASQKFCFEGYQEEPSSWIDNWAVQASSFTLRVF